MDQNIPEENKAGLPAEKLIVLKEKKMEENFAQDVQEGLASRPKRIPSKYFYDETGSRLFEKIMKLPEYYLTNCEWDIFKKHKDDILQLMGSEAFHLVDLGAGDAKKTKVLIEHFSEKKAKFNYVPIDISKDILEVLLNDLQKEFDGLAIQAVASEYFEALAWLKNNKPGRKLVLFMGGNIGNFKKEEALAFAKKIHDVLNPGDLLLIGFDLKKDPEVILEAYSDSQGVTADFNYNLLERMNRELGADFNIDNFKHYASYDPVTGATQSFLISQKKQQVYINELDTTVNFEAFEPIHTEYSYKYTLDEVQEMSHKCNFELITNYFCEKAFFIDSIWKAK